MNERFFFPSIIFLDSSILKKCIMYCYLFMIIGKAKRLGLQLTHLAYIVSHFTLKEKKWGSVKKVILYFTAATFVTTPLPYYK